MEKKLILTRSTLESYSILMVTHILGPYKTFKNMASAFILFNLKIFDQKLAFKPKAPLIM